MYFAFIKTWSLNKLGFDEKSSFIWLIRNNNLGFYIKNIPSWIKYIVTGLFSFANK